jgi:hypothetical protein
MLILIVSLYRIREFIANIIKINERTSSNNGIRLLDLNHNIAALTAKFNNKISC